MGTKKPPRETGTAKILKKPARFRTGEVDAHPAGKLDPLRIFRGLRSCAEVAREKQVRRNPVCSAQ